MMKDRFYLQCCIVGGGDEEEDFYSSDVNEIIAKVEEFEEHNYESYYFIYDRLADNESWQLYNVDDVVEWFGKYNTMDKLLGAMLLT